MRGSDEVRHVGEIVAIVVAKTPAAAKDAAELVAIAWETLTPVTRAVGAARRGRRVPASTCQ
jgi:carbon-monoxide dehydrogenase large subunit